MKQKKGKHSEQALVQPREVPSKERQSQALPAPVQDREWQTGVSLVKGHENDQGAGAHNMRGDAEGTGLV